VAGVSRWERQDAGAGKLAVRVRAFRVPAEREHCSDLWLRAAAEEEPYKPDAVQSEARSFCALAVLALAEEQQPLAAARDVPEAAQRSQTRTAVAAAEQQDARGQVELVPLLRGLAALPVAAGQAAVPLELAAWVAAQLILEPAEA
jgi:hypothetical protein